MDTRTRPSLSQMELRSVSKRGRAMLQSLDCHILRLSSEELLSIFDKLDFASALAMSATCKRLYWESTLMRELKLRNLRHPLSIERAATFLSRFQELRVLTVGEDCFSAPDGVPNGLAGGAYVAARFALLPTMSPTEVHGMSKPGLEVLEIGGNRLSARFISMIMDEINLGDDADSSQVISPLPLRRLDLSNTMAFTWVDSARRDYFPAPMCSLLRHLYSYAPNLAELRLADNAIQPDALRNITALIPRLERLDLSGNKLGDEGFTCIVHAIMHPASTSNLIELRLDSNFISSGHLVTELLRGNKVLKTLTLAWNDICADGALKISEGLREFSHDIPLSRLDLSYNTFLLKATHSHGPPDLRAARALRRTIRSDLLVHTWGI